MCVQLRLFHARIQSCRQQVSVCLSGVAGRWGIIYFLPFYSRTSPAASPLPRHVLPMSAITGKIVRVRFPGYTAWETSERLSEGDAMRIVTRLSEPKPGLTTSLVEWCCQTLYSSRCHFSSMQTGVAMETLLLSYTVLNPASIIVYKQVNTHSCRCMCVQM